jgi:hypothetical protein
MKKVVCLHNVYHEGRYLNAGVDVGLPDEVACNWVKRGLAKFVGGETPVNPPAVPPIEKPEVQPAEKADVPLEITPEGKGVVKFENDETPVSPNEENENLRYDFTTPIPAPAPEETPVADVDTPKRGRPPKKKHGGKRR